MSYKSCFNQIAYVIALEKAIYSLSMLEKAIEVFFLLAHETTPPASKKIVGGGFSSIFITYLVYIRKSMQNMAITMALILYTHVDCAFNIPQHSFNALPM
jgi:hypothetical protein